MLVDAVVALADLECQACQALVLVGAVAFCDEDDLICLRCLTRRCHEERENSYGPASGVFTRTS